MLFFAWFPICDWQLLINRFALRRPAAFLRKASRCQREQSAPRDPSPAAWSSPFNPFQTRKTCAYKWSDLQSVREGALISLDSFPSLQFRQHFDCMFQRKRESAASMCYRYRTSLCLFRHGDKMAFGASSENINQLIDCAVKDEIH